MAHWIVAQFGLMLSFYSPAGVNVSKNPGDAGDSLIQIA